MSVEGEGGAVAGEISEGVAITFLNILVGVIQFAEAVAQGVEGLGIEIFFEEAIAAFAELFCGEFAMVLEDEALGDIVKRRLAGVLGILVIGPVVDLEEHP